MFTGCSRRLLFSTILGLLVISQTSLALAGDEGFIPNSGRLDPQVLYYGTSSAVDVFFTENSVVFDIKDPASLAEMREAMADPDNALPLPSRRGQSLHLNFPGANPGVQLIADQENSARHSFFFGNDSRNWISDQSSFRTLTYSNLWNGVDLVFTLDQGQLTYEIIGNTSAANLQWDGADRVRTTASGTEIITAYGTIIDNGSSISRPVQNNEDNLIFSTRGAGALLWSTMIGGTGDEEGATLAITSNGDVIVAGETTSPDFPGTPGAYEEDHFNYLDIFVSRFSNEGGTLVWSTYIGTSNYDYVNGICLDASDNPIIAGRSASSSYPTTAGAYDETYNGGSGDATVTKLSSDGSTLMFSTFVGGSEVDSFFDIIPDASGNLVCVGYTASSNYPVTGGVYQTTFAGPPYDFTVSILSADGSTLNAGTYVGGTDRDACRGVAIDSNGDIFLSGFSFSSDFPVTAGTFQTVKATIDDAALVKISADLTTVHWATFIGGNGSERALCIDLDDSGDPVIAGFTYSTDFPTTTGTLQENYISGMEGFITKFNNADGTRDWSTYLGGAHVDEIVSLVMDASDNPVVTGWTTSGNFPVNNLGYDESHNGGEDIFVTRLSPDGANLLWGTYLGDSNDDRGMEVIMDADDNPVVTGLTEGPSFPVSVWAYDQTHNGGDDAILARFDTGDANLSISVANDQIGCGTNTTVAFSYNPDQPHTPPLRGYSVRIQAPLGLTFETTDINVLSPLVGVNDTFQIIENATGDCTIDFSFLDQGAGLTIADTLFTINMTGDSPGTSSLGISNGIFRDEDNHPFDVETLATADISVDCTPADTPTLTAEPLFTIGTTNTLSWSDESASGAVSYNVQASDQSDFSVISSESGDIAGLSYEFTSLTSGVTYYYRVSSENGSSQNSAPSASVSSTQDADLPVSSVTALPGAVGTTFDIAYTASDSGSGLESVELFYNYAGGAFATAGVHTTSPISFTASDGDGTYGFYTVALDSVGNTEAAPGSADTSTSVDTTAPNAPTLTAEPSFTAGLANTVTCSDESASGAVNYNFQISQLSDFSVIDSESGPVATLSHEFTSLADGTLYYYRATAIDNMSNASAFSAAVSSTQDASAPTSSVTVLADQNTATFDVPFSATDAGSGVETVELFTNFAGGAFASYGTFSASPISFTAASGEGSYGFYTVATDSLGNAEADPAAAQQTSVLDTTNPESSVQALAPYQTSGIFNVTASGTDNLTGIASYELFYSLDAGAWTSSGSTTDGLFSFTSVGDGTYGFYSVATDSVGNSEAAAASADATTSVDTSGPTGTIAINGGMAATNDTAVTLDMTIAGATEMRFSNDNVTFPDGWVAFAASQAWVLDATEGTRTVYAEFRDIAGNLLQINDTIEYDLQATDLVTFLELAPHHESVSLVWHNPDDADLDHLEIWRGLLRDGVGATAYPDYTGNVVPPAVADRAAALASPAWELAGTTSGVVEAFSDTVLTRGVYYYEVFAVDTAGNFSNPNGMMPAATNYVLGDMMVAFNGLVDIDDITTLGATYGLNDGDSGFNKHADIGPTDDLSGTGIPQPNDIVDFQDMMITTNNYGLAAKSNAAKSDAAKNQGPVILSWVQTSTNSFTLALHSVDTGLKGFNISADLPQNATASVTAGDLLRQQDNPVFLQNIAANGLDAGCAIIGAGLSIAGEGELLLVTVNDCADLTVLDMENLGIILRDSNNHDLEYSFAMATAVDIPSTFALERNYPNPFNPSTSISFSLPQQEMVQLEIYGVDGRRVALLLSETMEAGHHQITWTGRDDSGHLSASGVYFYRIHAGGFTDVKKMTLMK